MSRMISVPRGRQRYEVFVICSFHGQSHTCDEEYFLLLFFILTISFRISLTYVAVADLAAREDKPLEGFGLFGVVKEVGVDDEGMYFYTVIFASMISVNVIANLVFPLNASTRTI